MLQILLYCSRQPTRDITMKCYNPVICKQTAASPPSIC